MRRSWGFSWDILGLGFLRIECFCSMRFSGIELGYFMGFKRISVGFSRDFIESNEGIPAM